MASTGAFSPTSRSCPWPVSPKPAWWSATVWATGGLAEVEVFLTTYDIEIAPVVADDHGILLHALLDFGKGRRRPPAVLNVGDRFAYALARRLRPPLLYKGDDFARTDIEPVPIV